MISTKITYSLKHVTIVRLCCWPIINLVRLWKKYRFQFGMDSKYICSFKNKYQGQRCFIIGNGPSLTLTGLENIGNEISFGANRIYKLFDKTDWRPTFYMVSDPEIIEEDINILQNIDTPNKFISDIGKKYITNGANGLTFFNLYSRFTIAKYTTQKIKFSEELEKYFNDGYTVTYIAIQFAVFMGFTEIYLLGMDHTYNKVIDSKGRVITNDGVINHCFEDSKKSTIGYQYLEGVNFAYQITKEYCDTHNIKIYNATRGGKLEVFERVEFDNLFEVNKKNEDSSSGTN